MHAAHEFILDVNGGNIQPFGVLRSAQRWLFRNIQFTNCSTLHISPASTMAATSTRAKNTISLKGSSAIVAEYFNYAVNKWVGKGEATATAAAVIENNVCIAHHTSVLPWHLLQHSIPARDIPNRQLSAGAALWAEHDGVQGPGPNSLPADSHQADVKCVAARLAASAIQSCTSGTGYCSRP